MTGPEFCLANPDVLYEYHKRGKKFLAISPKHGVLYSGADESDLEAELNDLPPSMRSRFFLTCTSLWVQEAQA